MRYLRALWLVLFFSPMMIAAALAFAWWINADDAASGLHLEQREWL